MRNALERIADLDATSAVFASPVCIGRSVDGEWKPGAEGEVGIQLPSVGQPSGAMGRTGNVVEKEGIEVVPDIVVRVAVVALEVGGVLRKRAYVLGNFVEAVAPGVRKLRSDAMPTGGFEQGLKGIKVGSANALDFIDDAEIRIGTRAHSAKGQLVYVDEGKQAAALGAHVSDLQHSFAAE